MKKWRMAKPCADCPFNSSGPGLHLRKSLHPGRWREILKALRSDKHFMCHKTTRQTGDGSNRLCAGSIAWQAARDLSSNYQRICERLEWFSARRREGTSDA